MLTCNAVALSGAKPTHARNSALIVKGWSNLFLVCVFLFTLIAPPFIANVNAAPDSVRILEVAAFDLANKKSIDPSSRPSSVFPSVYMYYTVVVFFEVFMYSLVNDQWKLEVRGMTLRLSIYGGASPAFDSVRLGSEEITIFPADEGVEWISMETGKPWTGRARFSAEYGTAVNAEVPQSTEGIRIVVDLKYTGSEKVTASDFKTYRWGPWTPTTHTLDKPTTTATTATTTTTVSMVVTLQTEGGYGNQPTSTYEQGEAVAITGQVLFDGKPLAASGITEYAIKIHVQVPGTETTGLVDVKGTTNVYESGQYSIMPFAGWNIGEYRLRIVVTYRDQVQSTSAESATTFQVVKAAKVTDMKPQLEKIEVLYKQKIPLGPPRTLDPDMQFWIHGRGAEQRRYSLSYYLSFYTGGSEWNYGSFNNDILIPLSIGAVGMGTYGRAFPPDKNPMEFMCAAYQEKVLIFLNSIRFNPDPSVRALLRGLDYGPIQRGLEAGVFSHHAVVIYPIGTSWDSDWNDRRVLDPWPKQKPEITNLYEFRWWGPPLSGPLRVRPDSEFAYGGYTKELIARSSIPLTGAPIYANWEMIEKGKTPPAPPPTSLSANCHVDVVITDSQGKRVGMLPDGTFVQEFPAFAYRGREGDEVSGWYFELPSGSYDVVIAGQLTETFLLVVSGEAAGGEILDYGSQAITEDAQATISLKAGENRPLLSLPDGTTVSPQVLSLPPDVLTTTTARTYLSTTCLTCTTDTYYSTTTTETYDDLGDLEGIAFLGLIGIAVVLSAVFLYRRRKPRAVPPEQQPPSKAPLIVGQEQYAFCEACGRRIPAGSPYCPDCGDKQGV